MSSSHAVFHPLTIAAIEPLTEDAVAITFDVPEELRSDYAFTQGQHVTIRTELAGYNLACWCKPGTPCHADVLVELANS